MGDTSELNTEYMSPAKNNYLTIYLINLNNFSANILITYSFNQHKK
jgi:hypothetical protein